MFSNSYIKWRLHYVMLRFVAVPFLVVNLATSCKHYIKGKDGEHLRNEFLQNYVAFWSMMIFGVTLTRGLFNQFFFLKGFQEAKTSIVKQV